jgi:hypothetical protein
VPDYLDDIASDFSVFHRVGDITVMPGPAFFRLAPRLSAYAGAMQARALEARDEQPSREPQARGASSGASEQQQFEPATRASLMADSSLRGIFSFGTGGGG